MQEQSLKISGVYALIDPNTRQVRYVGQSKNIHKRYVAHLSAPRKAAYPVTMWVRKLRDQGLRPEIKVLEKHARPESIEKAWIAKMREEGANLLNIHEGGGRPASTGNGVTTKIWSVNGLPTPWMFLCRTMFSQRKIESVNIKLKEMKKERDSRKTEYDLLMLELVCARVLLENYGKETKQVSFAEKWLMGVAGKVNEKYPETVIVMSVDGERLA